MLLLSQNEHPKVVQERLGHARISITLDTYSHVLPSMQKAAAEKLDRIFSDLNSDKGVGSQTANSGDPENGNGEFGYKLATEFWQVVRNREAYGPDTSNA